MQHEDEAIRNAYAEVGVESFYRQRGASYHNPHEAHIRRILHEIVGAWQLDTRQVLDLACGSGEVTLALRELGAGEIQGIDPYTYEAYAVRTGQVAEQLSFEQIAAGALVGRSYTLVACSFALHLVELSRLPLLCYRLGEISPALLILTPHKRPVIKPEWGWQLADETVIDRVRARLYASIG